ncbi:MAG: hypothetical protein IJ193_03175, partial [Bacilli bacterium]|nr:hypothetical protein [Bacilli bacterium]
MRKFQWNRLCTILVLIMFVTVTYASFNTELFVNGNAYLRVNKDIRITNIRLFETEYNGYENTNSEYTADSVSMDVSLPRQASSVTYQVTVSNVSDKRYKITDILESSYNNKDVKYELVDASIGNIVEPHTEKTFTIKFTNNVTIVEEEDVYETEEYTFDYTGGEQVFTVPYDGEYTLEVWGAQGGKTSNYRGGYGGYSRGIISLKKNKKIYINIGGAGKTAILEAQSGGYNGGGAGNGGECNNTYRYAAPGGGATHIAYTTGTLNKLASFKGTLVNNSYYNSNQILIVAGGGGGAQEMSKAYGDGASAGGYIGNKSFWTNNGHNYFVRAGGGTQTSGGTVGYSYMVQEASGNRIGSFGQGGYHTGGNCGNWSGGGGGFYGGGSGEFAPGGGGSGYIGTSNLTNKEMYCYQCSESEDESTKTVSTNNHSTTPTSNYAKEGNGYAKITLKRKIQDNSEFDFDYTGTEQTLSAPYTGIYRLEAWGSEGALSKWGGTAGRGGYATGLINLTKNEQLHIYVGGKTPFNGGGGTEADGENGGAKGGGATHIATVTGELKTLSNKLNDILIVAGGGGAAERLVGGSGGGFEGNNGTSSTTYPGYGSGGTQTAGGQGMTNNDKNPSRNINGSFGQAGIGTATDSGPGGGGGFYGGGAVTYAGAGGGGSGYIGNSRLYDKVMYCYNCKQSDDANTKTVSTKAYSSTPKVYQAKTGQGFSRITLVKRTINQTSLTLDFTFEEYSNGNEYVFGFTGEEQTFNVPRTGYYKVELWGAEGGAGRLDWSTIRAGGLGGYTSGTIKLNKGEKLYVYVGGHPEISGTIDKYTGGTGGYNGGGNGGNDGNKDADSEPGGAGGGATDIRLLNGSWDDFDSLKSRIMVAGAGGGGTYFNLGGVGGTLTGSTYQFGIGQNGVDFNSGTGGGGSGYYGGSTNDTTSGGLGSGGTSYISGHEGCDSISDSSTEDNISHTGSSNHYSHYIFTNTTMIDGAGYSWTDTRGTEVVGMPTHDGSTTMTGNSDDGFAKITFIEEVPEYTFEYTGDVQAFTAPYKGTYKIELWGAQGGNVGSLIGALGGYTSGTIQLDRNKKLYLYVGEHPAAIEDRYSFNGGGRGTVATANNTTKAGGGGGATDIRLEKDDWNSFSSLKSRIMIASGGSGFTRWDSRSIPGGEAGGLIGYNGYSSKTSEATNYLANATGATQISAGLGSAQDEPTSEEPFVGKFGMGGYHQYFTK